VAKVTDGEAGV